MEHRTYIDQGPDGWHWCCPCGSRSRKPAPTVDVALKLASEHRSVIRRRKIPDVPTGNNTNLRRYYAYEKV